MKNTILAVVLGMQFLCSMAIGDTGGSSVKIVSTKLLAAEHHPQRPHRSQHHSDIRKVKRLFQRISANCDEAVFQYSEHSDNSETEGALNKIYLDLHKLVSVLNVSPFGDDYPAMIRTIKAIASEIFYLEIGSHSRKPSRYFFENQMAMFQDRITFTKSLILEYL